MQVYMLLYDPGTVELWCKSRCRSFSSGIRVPVFMCFLYKDCAPCPRALLNSTQALAVVWSSERCTSSLAGSQIESKRTQCERFLGQARAVVEEISQEEKRAEVD